MHELSIAENILEIIHDNVPAGNLSKVRKVKLEVGDMSGVVADSLDFCYMSISLETPLADSALEIERIPFRLKCNDCSMVTGNTSGIRECDSCGSFNTEVISGTELRVKEIELAE
jgi:hydrogenase nickel incorporation protein HypA/HybF